jgi:membrane protein DedA with SNARE-associated domain
MQEILGFLLRYGYWVLFLNVLAEQLAIPLPATPVLLAMGALAGLGHFSLLLSILIASIACLICDQLWYRLGRTRGLSILRLICRISIEPDSCVSGTKTTFAKYGAWSLVFAKFVPGLSAVAAPMAGLTRMPVGKFLVADFAGSVAWTGSFILLGYAFRNQLEVVAAGASRFGGWALSAAVAGVAIYVAFKYYERRKFLRGLEVARISPEELLGLMESGEEPILIDVRHAIEFENGGVKLPGALQLDPEEIQSFDMPSGKDVIVYCS